MRSASIKSLHMPTDDPQWPLLSQLIMKTIIPLSLSAWSPLEYKHFLSWDKHQAATFFSFFLLLILRDLRKAHTQKTLTKRAAPTCRVQSLFYEWRQAQPIHIPPTSPLEKASGRKRVRGLRTPTSAAAAATAAAAAAAGRQTHGKYRAARSEVAGSHGESELSGVCVPREDPGGSGGLKAERWSVGEMPRGQRGGAERREGGCCFARRQAASPSTRFLPLSFCLPVCTVLSLFTTWALFLSTSSLFSLLFCSYLLHTTLTSYECVILYCKTISSIDHSNRDDEANTTRKLFMVSIHQNQMRV